MRFMNRLAQGELGPSWIEAFGDKVFAIVVMPGFRSAGLRAGSFQFLPMTQR